MRAMTRVGGCERCLTPKLSWKQLQCSHFHGRARKSVRWDEDNGAGFCGACHLYFTSHPLEHVEWFKVRLGQERFELLECRANQIYKPDIEAITLYLKHKIRELEGNDTH